MGGMAAQIPVKCAAVHAHESKLIRVSSHRDDAKANEAAFEKVRRDKLREVKAACDGTWVAHPGSVSGDLS